MGGAASWRQVGVGQQLQALDVWWPPSTALNSNSCWHLPVWIRVSVARSLRTCRRDTDRYRRIGAAIIGRIVGRYAFYDPPTPVTLVAATTVAAVAGTVARICSPVTLVAATSVAAVSGTVARICSTSRQSLLWPYVSCATMCVSWLE